MASLAEDLQSDTHSLTLTLLTAEGEKGFHVSSTVVSFRQAGGEQMSPDKYWVGWVEKGGVRVKSRRMGW